MIQDQLQKLYELSRLDTDIDRIREKVGHVPVRRETITHTLQEKQVSLEDKKGKMAILEKEKRSLEVEVQSSQERLKEIQTRTNQLKTNKEYQASLKEIAETKMLIKGMEERLLKVMTELEGVSQQALEEDKELQSYTETVGQELKDLEGEEVSIAGEIKAFAARRDELLSSLEKGFLAQYEKIKKFRSDAVTTVDQGACGGCYMRVPSQLLIEIQKLNVIHACPSCQRILYLPGGVR